MEYLKAAFASGAMALFLVVAMSAISSGGGIYFAEVDWAKVDTMKYAEAQQYLAERSKSITRWESLKNGISYSAFWISALADWVLYFLVGFMSCILYRRLSQFDASLNSASQGSTRRAQ